MPALHQVDVAVLSKRRHAVLFELGQQGVDIGVGQTVVPQPGLDPHPLEEVAGGGDGTVDALVSDHSRVSKDGKALPFTSAHVGARGLELLLSLALHWQQQHKLPLAQALQCVTSKPAAILGQHSASLQVGQPADVCVVNLQADNAINTDEAFMPLSPFAANSSGYALQGQVLATLVAGQICYAAHS